MAGCAIGGASERLKQTRLVSKNRSGEDTQLPIFQEDSYNMPQTEFVKERAIPNKVSSIGSPLESIKGNSQGDETSIIALRDAAVRFGNRTIWQHATFSIAPGEFIALLGPNGAGKSTLIQLLLGLIKPSAGSVMVLGQHPHKGNHQIGYVPQRRILDADLPVRGRDMVMLGLDGLRWGFALPGSARKQQHAQVEEALAAVEATTYANRPIGKLSGGEQQRLFLAQALVSKPRLLMLDEPLASLDMRSQMGIVQLVAQLARERGITVLLVTHDINPVLPAVDRIVYMARGQVAIGTAGEIITTEKLSGLYDAPVEVVRDSLGRIFVVGIEEAEGH
jgi:zinc/manganese transport system ATP-binding protein